MSSKNVSWDYLPGEIVTNILLLLPVKSILTCICVCKTWKSIIQNNTFVSSHLHSIINNNNHNHHLMFRIWSKSKQLYVLHNDDDDDNFTQHTTFDFPFNGPGLKGMYTCNGLVCLSDFVYKFFLWNPCVKKCMELPSPNVTYKTHVWFKASIGFGFDAKNNDFKVVRVVSPRHNADNADIQKDRPEVEVYSLSTGEWRMVTASLPPICLVKRCENQVYVNGAIHWLAFRRDDDYKKLHFVLVFDLGDEVFWEIPLPEIPESTHGGICELHAIYGNSIALLQRKSYFVSLNIWVMKEYGVVSSWTKVFAIVEQDVEPWPMGFRRNGQVVLKLKSGGLVSQDLESQERKDLRITSGWISAFVDSYVESLVLLDKPANSSAVTY